MINFGRGSGKNFVVFVKNFLPYFLNKCLGKTIDMTMWGNIFSIVKLFNLRKQRFSLKNMHGIEEGECVIG